MTITEQQIDRIADALESLQVDVHLGCVADDPKGSPTITDALDGIADALKWLGNGDASTPMGAIEAHGKAILDAADKIAASIDNLADAIREHRPS